MKHGDCSVHLVYYYTICVIFNMDVLAYDKISTTKLGDSLTVIDDDI